LVETVLPRPLRERFGRHLWNRACGDNNEDMERNGERALVARLQRALVGQSAVVFDAGANVGNWSARLAPGLHESAALYAFEPVAANFTRLQGVADRLGPMPRLVPVHAALGEVDGEVEIFKYGGDLSGAHSVHERDVRAMGTKSSGSEAVQCWRGDTFCRERNIDRIAFVKLDVEGNELAVLRGFSSALAGSRIGAVQFEYCRTWIDARIYLKDAFELLLPLGYALGKLLPDGVQWYDRYDYGLETFQYANFVAARPEWKQHLSARS